MLIKTFAPVIITTLNRFDHFKQCLESLENCKYADETDVYIALDYPPSEEYEEGWKLIDRYIRDKEKQNGFKNLIVYRRTENYFFSGRGNLRVAINDLPKNVDRYITSEDDNIFSPLFLEYMNLCLEKYEDNPDVVCVTGYSYPVDWSRSEGATIQLQNFNASAWGWAWWREKKNKIENDFLDEILFHNATIDIKNGKYKRLIAPALIEYTDYIKGADVKLQKRMTDVGMRIYIAMRDKYVVSPLISFVRNKGFDGSGQYCGNNQHLLDNSNALTYDYVHQPIYESDNFNIVENNNDLLEENRCKLSKFDNRSYGSLCKSMMVIWEVKLLGISYVRIKYKLKSLLKKLVNY